MLQKNIIICSTCLLGTVMNLSCKKLVTIDGPSNTITTTQIFNSDVQAEGALAGMYTSMINGISQVTVSNVAERIWSSGLVNLMGSLSAGDLYNSSGAIELQYNALATNNLTIYNSSVVDACWTTAYGSIYGANSVIEGIAASTSSSLREAARKQFTGEAKFVRALAYFYLTNFFGDVPLALTVDFNKTIRLPRAPQREVYEQIVRDLKDAQEGMRDDYSIDRGQRVRPNKWAATALLARTYLYMGDHANAVAAATAVINRQELFRLGTELQEVFGNTSQETIWQLKQTNLNSVLNNATPEGYVLLPFEAYHGNSRFILSNETMNAFEPGDERRAEWVDSTDNTSGGRPYNLTFYPTKYKIGSGNGAYGAPQTEFYIVLRLAEMFLIRAEAAANDGPGGLPAAINDLNTIRHRAKLPDLPNTLTKDQVIAAVARERHAELFAEWAHRWLDLRRTGKAHEVLSAIPMKQPWVGDYQLLYPIPPSEIRDNNALLQNPGY